MGRNAIDWRAIMDGQKGPGADTRTWISFGVVGGEATPNGEEPCVDFSTGQPLVRVMLQPDLVPCWARVRMNIAGNGEGEWEPFLPGDEVICAIPEGNYRAGVVILGKLCNDIDRFPSESVAGQDPKLNNFAFRRRRTPVIEEQAGPVAQRNALTGGFWTLAEDGSVTIKAGDPTNPTGPGIGALQISADMLALQSADGRFLFQLNQTDGLLVLRAGDAVVSLSDSGSAIQNNMISVGGVLILSVGGNPPIEHVATTEATFTIVTGILQALSAAFALLIPPTINGPAIAVVINGVLAALPGLVAGIGTAGISPTLTAAITSAFAAQLPKPNSLIGQTSPGLGIKNLLSG